MVESKGWSWNDVKNPIWLEPSEESYFYAHKWMKAFKEKNPDTDRKPSVLDLGCGLGRHAVLFAKEGFKVSAIDISRDAVKFVNQLEKKENVIISSAVGDILHLPYSNNAFDFIWSYMVISHTDTEGFKQIVSELKRVIRPEGQLFITLCAKDTWSFTEANFPKIDENTVLKSEPPAEIDVPHFFVNLDDILTLFSDFEIPLIRHIDNCYVNGKKQNNRHYYVELTCHKEAEPEPDYSDIIGRTVEGHIDRPSGGHHPRVPTLYYPINYGYIDGVFANDGSEQDIYLLGVDRPVEVFKGKVIAVFHRYNDIEDKWIVVPEDCNKSFTAKEILDAINFQEKFFDGKLYM